MRLWVRNESDQLLEGLRVQNCVMLRGLNGFAQQTTDNKLQVEPYIACHDRAKRRWVITAWNHCRRTWPNPDCPCMHSDPQVPDCAPGETQQVSGWLSFYEGEAIQDELQRLERRLRLR